LIRVSTYQPSRLLKKLPIRIEKKKLSIRTIYRVRRKLRRFRRYCRAIRRISNLPRIRKQLKRRLNRSKGSTKLHVSRRNLICKSYFRRYRLRRRRRLFKRTRYLPKYQAYNYHGEMLIFSNLQKDIAFYERNPFRAKRFRYPGLSKPLHKRVFSLGRVFITTRRRNTFITIEELTERDAVFNNRVIYKTRVVLLDIKVQRKGHVIAAI